jgi:hypothetical protein
VRKHTASSSSSSKTQPLLATTLGNCLNGYGGNKGGVLMGRVLASPALKVREKQERNPLFDGKNIFSEAI